MEKSSSRPFNVEQIVDKAKNFDYNPLIPFKYWLRTAGTLLKEAEIYEHEGNDQQTYLLLYRHAQLVIGHLSGNPEAKKSPNRHALAHAQKDVEYNIAKLEVLKPRINRRYERFEQLLRDRDARKANGTTIGALPPHEHHTPSQSAHRRSPSDPAVTSGMKTLEADANRDLAVQLAHKEIRRRATARKATRQAGISEQIVHERRTAGLWGNWEQDLTSDNGLIDRDGLSNQMQNVHLMVNGPTEQLGSSRPSSEGHRNYHYPAVPETGYTPQVRRIPPGYTEEKQAPIPPPKAAESAPLDQLPPPRPEKEPALIDGSSRASRGNSASQRDEIPSTFTFKPSAYLENGTPLRTIFLPPDLRHRFLTIALPNTRANLETCGILCGTLVSNALFISKLVIPDQECTSDTCETINESELFDYVDGEDLMVLGWIHTHPTQTCFMSSRDLHTHGGYQVMMPESISIVCAPSKGDWGVFRLTDPPGMKTILNCTQTGLFHPHAESNVYTDALRPGHVYEAKGLEFDVVDLRPAKSF